MLRTIKIATMTIKEKLKDFLQFVYTPQDNTEFSLSSSTQDASTKLTTVFMLFLLSQHMFHSNSNNLAIRHLHIGHKINSAPCTGTILTHLMKLKS